MSKRKARILMAKCGDGYEEAMLKLARSFSEAGYEVIYTDLQDPRAIVATAIQESVDHIGITALPGAQIDFFSEMFNLLAKEDMTHIRVTAGGYLAENDVAKIKKMGVVEFFPKGTSHAQLIEWSKKNVEPVDS